VDARARLGGLRRAPEIIEKVARAYATEKPGAILMGGGSNHWYHGDLVDGRTRCSR